MFVFCRFWFQILVCRPSTMTDILYGFPQFSSNKFADQQIPCFALWRFRSQILVCRPSILQSIFIFLLSSWSNWSVYRCLIGQLINCTNEISFMYEPSITKCHFLVLLNIHINWTWSLLTQTCCNNLLSPF